MSGELIVSSSRETVVVLDSPTLPTWSDDQLHTAIRNGVENLKAYLEEAVRRQWSQSDIAEALGIDRSGVSRRMKALGVAPKQIQKKGVQERTPSSDGFKQAYAFVTEVRFQHDATDQDAAEAWAQRLAERVSRSGPVCVYRITRAI